MMMNHAGRLWSGGIVLLGALILFLPVSQAAEMDQKTFYASKIIDQEVYGPQGSQIAEVDDLIIRNTGKIKRATLDVGGFLGIDEKLVALPFKDLLVGADGRLSVALSDKDLEARPGFSYYRHGLQQGYAGWCPPYPYYGRRHYGGYRGSYEAYPPGASAGPRAGVWSWYSDRFLASTVLQRVLFNDEGVGIGIVKDLLISREGKVEDLVITAEEILGKGKYVALPYQPLGFSCLGIVYSLTPEELKKLPEYPYHP